MKLKILLSLLVFSLFIVGCAPVEETPEMSGEVMKVVKLNWPGMYWIEIADEKGWFEEAGLNVELIDGNQDYYSSLQDVVDGEVNANGFSLFDVIAYNAKGADLVMVINADTSSGAEAIVASKRINTILDLVGKKVGLSKGFYTEYLFDIALKDQGVSKEQIEKVYDYQDEDLPLEFEKGSIDALITWEPIVSNAVKKGGKVIWDTSKIVGISPNGQVMRRAFIQQRPKDVQAYINVWHKTTEFIKTNPAEAFKIISDIYDVPVGDVQAFTQDDKILDLEDNKIAFSYAAGFESLHGTAKQINNFMIENNITDKQLDSTEFIDARFIRGVKE
jgi:NitT/TauT family transport system substrate-binding protein